MAVCMEHGYGGTFHRVLQRRSHNPEQVLRVCTPSAGLFRGVRPGSEKHSEDSGGR